MIYSFSLQAVAIVIGLAYLLGHLPGFFRPAAAADWLKTVPRSVPLGFTLFGIAFAWTLWLVLSIDLGEFSPYRTRVFLFFLALGIGVLVYARDYLAVRGLAALLCLAANVVLDAAYMRDEAAKLIYVTLAYVWVVVGIVLFFSPYRLRDAIAWATAKTERVKLLSAVGAGSGLVLLIIGLFAL